MNVFLYYDNNETKIKLLTPLQFEFKGIVYEVPIGFVSDGGTIPKMFWNIINGLDGRYLYCYVIHDYMYSGGVVRASRKDADSLLETNLKEAGMPMALRKSIYYSVRAFGASHWRK